MSWLRRARNAIARFGVGKAASAGGAVLAAGIWAFILNHFNPKFTYAAPTSSTTSHFVGLAQVLDSIDKDSQLNCTGGWDELIAWVGLRTCYHFTYSPRNLYRMMVCTGDQDKVEIRTADQLLALQYFQSRYSPLECFKVAPGVAKHDYIVSLGKDTRIKRVTFPGNPPEETGFCGCSEDDERNIARIIGASTK